MVVLPRNDALDINPPSGDTHLSDGGSDWLWAACAIFCLSTVIFIPLSFVARNNEKIFHYLWIIALLAGAINYFSEASDIGYIVIKTELNTDDAISYQVFFTKFIYWVVAWPICILDLGLMSGVSWTTMVFNIFLSWVWVICYLAAAVVHTTYRWGFYTFGTFTYLLLAYQTIVVGLKSARRFELSRDYVVLAGWLNLLWLLYPIAFAVSDAGNVISVTKSLIYFGVLDVLMIPVLAFGTIFFSSNWDYGKLNLHFTQYGRVASGEGVFPEKQPATATPAVPAEGLTAV